MAELTLPVLRRHATARSLFTPTTLPQAIRRLGYVQMDPIRAPARAQDLILRHRVKDYRAGEVESRYPRLGLEEDFFVNYGLLPAATHHLMHPRAERRVWSADRWAQAREVLAFVRERGVVHPRDVDQAFDHGRVTNWFGGTSNASTQLLDGMHYRGLVRTARRESGIRLYAAREPTPAPEDCAAALDTLVDVIVGQYAPLPASSLTQLLSYLRVGVPQWQHEHAALVRRTKARLASATVDGTLWFWPVDENPASRRHAVDDAVRLLAPFDPVVWDRRRFELLWGWAYRFEAYTPAAKRERGYYALPLLWRDAVIGWANVGVREGALSVETGFVGPRPRDAAFTAALDDELGRMGAFLGLG